MNQTSLYEIELLSPRALRPYPGNARTHSKKQIVKSRPTKTPSGTECIGLIMLG